MIDPFLRIKSVWNPADPMALHHEVERLALDGVTQDELESALIQLLLEIRSAGADDETEEIINGVADRLSGWCIPAHHIKTSDLKVNGQHANGTLTHHASVE